MFRSKQDEFYHDVVQKMKEHPLIIGDIAQGVSDSFELMTEFGDFANDEDDQITDLLLMLYHRENYGEAVRLLRLVFSLMGSDDAIALLALIHEGNGEEIEEQFVREFMFRSPRCRFREVTSGFWDEDGEE